MYSLTTHKWVATCDVHKWLPMTLGTYLNLPRHTRPAPSLSPTTPKPKQRTSRRKKKNKKKPKNQHQSQCSFSASTTSNSTPTNDFLQSPTHTQNPQPPIGGGIDPTDRKSPSASSLVSILSFDTDIHQTTNWIQPLATPTPQQADYSIDHTSSSIHSEDYDLVNNELLDSTALKTPPLYMLLHHHLSPVNLHSLNPSPNQICHPYPVT